MKDDDIPQMRVWNDIRLEIYCMINVEYFEKCNEFLYSFDSSDDMETWFTERNRIPNPKYDPTVEPVTWPEGCTQDLGISCLDCKYCCYCEYDEDLEEE
jgi:hypothetical protein